MLCPLDDVNDWFSCLYSNCFRGVTKEEILCHLSTENPVIILIDAAVLRCTDCYNLPHMVRLKKGFFHIIMLRPKYSIIG